jgi:membrane protease subunit HflK
MIKEKTIRRVIVAAIIVVAAIIILSGSFYTIREQEQAVVTTFGNPQAVTEPGLHFKIPFVQEVTKVNTTIQGISIGYEMGTNRSLEDESLMITSDFNFVNVDFFLEYKVVDPIKALYASSEPAFILKNIALSCIRSTIGLYDVDSVITTGKNEIQSVIREAIMQRLEAHNIGLQLVNITIQDAEPPTADVIEAFKAVETAKQGKETAINNAQKYRNEQLPAAEAKIDRILKTAEAQKQARINEATGQAARFEELFKEYIKYPTVTKQRMFFEAMSDLLPDLTVVIDNSETGVSKVLPLESFTGPEN